MTQVCKPNSVIPHGTAIIYLIPTLLSEFSGLPEEIESEQLSSGYPEPLLLDLAPGGVCRDPGKTGTPETGPPVLLPER